MIELAFKIAALIILVPIALVILVVVGGGILTLVGAFLWNITFGLFQSQKEFMDAKQGIFGLFDDENKRPKEKNVSYFGPFKMTKVTQSEQKEKGEDE